MSRPYCSSVLHVAAPCFLLKCLASCDTQLGKSSGGSTRTSSRRQARLVGALRRCDVRREINDVSDFRGAKHALGLLHLLQILAQDAEWKRAQAIWTGDHDEGNSV